MFFDRSTDNQMLGSGVINVATISIYTRELYSYEDREDKILNAREAIDVLKNAKSTKVVLKDDPLIRKREQEIKALKQAPKDSINGLISSEVEVFLHELGCCFSKDNEDCLVINRVPEVLIKRYVDRV